MPVPKRRSDLEEAFVRTHGLLTEARARHLFVGGVAILAMGEPRMTQDVDLIVFLRKKSLPAFLGRAAKRGFRVDPRAAGQDAATRGAFSIRWRGVAVDLILASTDLEDSAWRRRKRVRLFGRTVHVPSAEDLILLKVIPGRPKDLADIEGIVASKADRLDRAYVERWARRLCDEAEDGCYLRQLAALGAVGSER